MTTTIVPLPPTRLSVLNAAYDEALKARRRQGMLLAAAVLICTALASYSAEVSPLKFFANIGNFTSYIIRLFYLDSGSFVLSDPVEWFWGLNKWSRLLAETLLIAYVGTALGAIAGFFLCFLAAANLSTNAWIRWPVRRFLEFSRTVPELVFALVFVIAFGLGPVPGVLAIAIHTMGALGKLFFEVAENIDMRPVEGVTATGGSWSTMVRFAVLPQVASNFVSYSLLRFEINVRGASVMGFVGAGGIGQDLLEAIRKFYYSDVSALLLLIIATVMVIDLVTERLRHRILHIERRA